MRPRGEQKEQWQGDQMTVRSELKTRQPGLAVPSRSGRVRNLEELSGRAYRRDGGCERGNNDWRTELWDGGYRVRCRQCGRRCCYHEIGGVPHTSERKWAPYPHNRKPRPPAGCESLTERTIEGPEGG